MSKNKHWAIWYLFTTMLSIFSICTIRIFDGFNWPFYAVTVNALISLGGLVFHIHMEEHARKSPGLLAARILLLLNSVSVFVMILQRAKGPPSATKAFRSAWRLPFSPPISWASVTTIS